MALDPRPEDPQAARDLLTRRRLAAAARGHGELRVLRFHPRWWDGAARVPCLVVRVNGARRRVVEYDGKAVLLPGSAWAARRRVGSWRRMPLLRCDRPLVVPAQRGPRVDPVLIAEPVDVVRCAAGCGGLLVVPAQECPRCAARLAA